MRILVEESKWAQACCGTWLSVGAKTAGDLSAADSTLTRLDDQDWAASTDFVPASDQTLRGNYSYVLLEVFA